MILSRSNVVHYLAEQGLLTPETIVDGDLMVADASRRNRNFKVIRRTPAGLFRQADSDWDPQTVATLGTEAMCYRLARGMPEFAPLAASGAARLPLRLRSGTCW